MNELTLHYDTRTGITRVGDYEDIIGVVDEQAITGYVADHWRPSEVYDPADLLESATDAELVEEVRARGTLGATFDGDTLLRLIKEAAAHLTENELAAIAEEADYWLTNRRKNKEV